MADFRQISAYDIPTLEAEAEKLAVLPNFEVSPARKKDVHNIHVCTWYITLYIAAVAIHFPKPGLGILCYTLVVLRAHAEIEDPASCQLQWCLYDVSYHEKKAATVSSE